MERSLSGMATSLSTTPIDPGQFQAFEMGFMPDQAQGPHAGPDKTGWKQGKSNVRINTTGIWLLGRGFGHLWMHLDGSLLDPVVRS